MSFTVAVEKYTGTSNFNDGFEPVLLFLVWYSPHSEIMILCRFTNTLVKHNAIIWLALKQYNFCCIAEEDLHLSQ